jgi:hypothetical protein
LASHITAWHQLKSDGPKGRRLPAKHAFVVQLSREALGTHDSFSGRAEHVVSGRATHFETVDELLAFIQRVLARLRQSRESGEGSEEA